MLRFLQSPRCKNQINNSFLGIISQKSTYQTLNDAPLLKCTWHGSQWSPWNNSVSESKLNGFEILQLGLQQDTFTSWHLRNPILLVSFVGASALNDQLGESVLFKPAGLHLSWHTHSLIYNCKYTHISRSSFCFSATLESVIKVLIIYIFACVAACWGPCTR